MIIQDKTAQKLLNFYYFVYGKLISFPFLYYELISNTDEAYCLGLNVDFSTCKCCAMKGNDLIDALSIIDIVNTTDSNKVKEKYPCERLPINYFSRELAQSLDLNYMSKGISMLISQLYIICLVLAQRDSNIDQSVTKSLHSSFKFYVYAVNKRIAHKFSTNNFPEENEICKEENIEIYNAILSCLNGEIPDTYKRDCAGKLSKIIHLLSEAMHYFAIFHDYNVYFPQTFSQTTYVIHEPNRTGFKNIS